MAVVASESWASRPRVALLFPSQHHGAVAGELVMRLLVIDTGDLE